MIINTLYEPRWDGKLSAGSDLHIRWREEEDGSWIRKEKRVTDFRPYGYVLRGSHHFVSGKDGVSRTVPTNLLAEQKNLWMVDGMVVVKVFFITLKLMILRMPVGQLM